MTDGAALAALKDRIEVLKWDADLASYRGFHYVQALYLDEMYRLYLELNALQTLIWHKSGLYTGRALHDRLGLPNQERALGFNPLPAFDGLNMMWNEEIKTCL